MIEIIATVVATEAIAPSHPLNWYAGWGLILSGFVSGAVVGLFFHKPEFLGGYDSFRRRLVRLGHIAQEALGMMNLLYALSPWPAATTELGVWASIAFVAGGVAMPLVCFLTAWRSGFRHLFFVPVAALSSAVIMTLLGGGR